MLGTKISANLPVKYDQCSAKCFSCFFDWFLCFVFLPKCCVEQRFI